MEASKNLLAIVCMVYAKLNLTFTTKQYSRVSCVAQPGFAVFGKGVQLISGFP